MKYPALIQQRYCYLPSWWLVLLLVVVSTGIGVVIFKNLAYFLALNSPVSSRYLVVEGWLPKSALERALEEFNYGNYKLLITSGGPNDSDCAVDNTSYAERAGIELIRLGLNENNLLIASAPASAQDRTFLSAVMVRKQIATLHSAVDAINIFTSDVHARRTHLLYQQAFRDLKTQIGVISIPPERFKLDRWWGTSEGAKVVLTEFIGWVWVKLFFYPDDLNSHGEMWGGNPA